MQLELDDLVDFEDEQCIPKQSMPQLHTHCDCFFDPGRAGNGALFISSVDLEELRDTEANHNHRGKKCERDERILQIGFVDKDQPEYHEDKAKDGQRYDSS